MAQAPPGSTSDPPSTLDRIPVGRMLGRYRLLERLGAGAMGLVFKALDTERGDIVALKTLQRLGPSALLGFKNEFRSVANIVHPNLVTLYELSCDGDIWFFTMEYISGRSLSDLITHEQMATGATNSTQLLGPAEPPAVDAPPLRTTYGSSPPAPPSAAAGHGAAVSHAGPGASATAAPRLVVPIPFLRRTFGQLAIAIDALHSLGKLHRDIKPANVMLSDSGRVVLLDFGLIIEVAPTFEIKNVVAGTPAYMAPEVATGAPAAEASDWYAVGVMLYEALTGLFPFAGSSSSRSGHDRVAAVLRGAQSSQELPRDLCELALALLDPDPARRPAGAEVLETLWSVGPAATLAGATSAQSLVGRESQLSALSSAFREVAASGRRTCVRIRGASGMGKSVLLEAFLADLRRRPEVLVLAGRCYQQEALPYKALDAVVDTLAQYLARRRKRGSHPELISPESFDDLARAFPVLTVGTAYRRETAVAENVGSPELRRRAFKALKQLLHRLSLESVLVVAIDDLQWGDADSGVILRELVSPPDPPRMMLVYSYRPEEGEASPILTELRNAELGAVKEFETAEVVVDALDPVQAGRLAGQLLGCSADHPLAVALAEESGGNPFFLERLARHTIHQPSSNRADGNAKVDELVLGQLVHIPEIARKLLEMVVVAGRPVNQTIVSRAVGEAVGERNAWAVLRAHRLVRPSGGRESDVIEVYHDRIREAILRQLSSPSVSLCHQRLGESLETIEGCDPEIPAGHFLAAGLQEKAGRYSVMAADRASQQLAFSRAADLYRQAMTCLPGEASLPARCADALVNAGRCAESAPLYLAAADSADPERAFELRTRAAEQLLTSGRIEEGLAILKPLLAAVGIRYPKTPVRALLGIIGRTILLRMRSSPSDRPATVLSPLRRKRIDVSWAAGKGLGSVDIMRGGYFIARSTDLAAQAGEPRALARGLAHIGLMTVSRAGASDVDRGMAQIGQSAELGRRLSDPYLAGFARINLGTAHMTLGQWGQARTELEEGLRMVESNCTGVSWECSFARACLINVLRCLGELPELSARGAEWLRTAAENGDRYGAVWIQIHTAAAVLARDEPQAATAQVERSVADWSWSLFTPQHMVATVLSAEFDLYRGEAEAASERLEAVWEVARKSFVMGWQITRIWALQVRAGAALAGARVQGPRRERLLARARASAALLAKEGKRPHVAGAAAVVRAGLASFGGQVAQAGVELDQAATQFDAAGMSLHAASARWVQGRLLDRPEVLDRAQQALAELGVSRVDRWAPMYVPGVLAP